MEFSSVGKRWEGRRKDIPNPQTLWFHPKIGKYNDAKYPKWTKESI